MSCRRWNRMPSVPCNTYPTKWSRRRATRGSAGCIHSRLTRIASPWRQLSSRCNRVLFRQQFQQVFSARQADVLRLALAGDEHHHRGNAADAVFRARGGGLVDVEVADFFFFGELVRKLFGDGGEGLAGTAPDGGKVHENGDVGLRDLFVPVEVVQVNQIHIAGHDTLHRSRFAADGAGMQRERRLKVRAGLPSVKWGREPGRWRPDPTL